MSRLITNSIRSTSASADAITFDGSGNATFPANATCSGTATGFGGGKILQHEHTQTQIPFSDGNWSWPTSVTDLAGHSIAMTKASSGTSYYLITVSSSLHYNSGSIEGRFSVYKDGSLLSPQASHTGMGLLHTPTQYVTEQVCNRMVVASGSGTYKLRLHANNTNFQLARGCFTTFTITEFE